MLIWRVFWLPAEKSRNPLRTQKRATQDTDQVVLLKIPPSSSDRRLSAMESVTSTKLTPRTLPNVLYWFPPETASSEAGSSPLQSLPRSKLGKTKETSNISQPFPPELLLPALAASPPGFGIGSKLKSRSDPRHLLPFSATNFPSFHQKAPLTSVNNPIRHPLP